MEQLENELTRLIAKLPDATAFNESLDHLISVYPFNRYEYQISALLDKHILTFGTYLELRNAYLNRNLFLPVFEISAPREFGDLWAFGHLMSLEPALRRPSKAIDPTYCGEYDLYLPAPRKQIVKIEVKSSRAVNRDCPDEPLYLKALSSDSRKRYLMNFQQLKPSCCDIFLWIAVFRDRVNYWVLNRDVVRSLPEFTPQHRNAATARRSRQYSRADIFEGQVMLTNENVRQFHPFETAGNQLRKAILHQFRLLKKDANQQTK